MSILIFIVITPNRTSKNYLFREPIEFTDLEEISTNISTYKTLEEIHFSYSNEIMNSVKFFKILYDGLPNVKYIFIKIFKTDFENHKVLEILDKFKEKGVKVKLSLI